MVEDSGCTEPPQPSWSAVQPNLVESFLQPLHPAASSALLQHTGGQRKQQCCLEDRRGLGTVLVRRCHGTAVVSVPNSCDIKQSNPSPNMLVSCTSREHHELVFHEEIGKPVREALKVGPTSFVLVTELKRAISMDKLGTSLCLAVLFQERGSWHWVKHKKYPGANIIILPALVASGY